MRHATAFDDRSTFQFSKIPYFLPQEYLGVAAQEWFHALTMECLPRFQRRSELQCHLPGDLKQPFDGRDMFVDVLPGGRAAHPFLDLPRMLCGEVEHEDGDVNFSSRLRMQAGDAGSEIRDIAVGARRLALPLSFTRARRLFPKINYVQHHAVDPWAALNQYRSKAH